MAIISHDRYFIDRTANRIFELEEGRIEGYPGNYAAYVADETRPAGAGRAIARAAGARVPQAQGERRATDAVGAAEPEVRLPRREHAAQDGRGAGAAGEHPGADPQPAPDRRRLRPPSAARRWSLEAKALAKSFGERVVFEPFDLEIRHGEAVGLVGANGSGKTTLFRIVRGEEQPSAGTLRLGPSVVVGYYAQEQETLDPAATPMESVRAAEADVGAGGDRRSSIATSSPATTCSAASAGSAAGSGRACRSRVLILQGRQLLLLDEPTNNLDIPSVERLEEALLAFLDEGRGTILTISHDRAFLDTVCGRIVELDDGVVRDYPGGFTWYDEHRGQGRELTIRPPGAAGAENEATRASAAAGDALTWNASCARRLRRPARSRRRDTMRRFVAMAFALTMRFDWAARRVVGPGGDPERRRRRRRRVRTNVRYFFPFTGDGLNPALTVRAEERGSCGHESLASPGRPDAWNCVGETSNAIYDPCFESPFSTPDEPGQLACVDAPFDSEVVLFTPTGPLPRFKEAAAAPLPPPVAAMPAPGAPAPPIATGDKPPPGVPAAVIAPGMPAIVLGPGGDERAVALGVRAGQRRAVHAGHRGHRRLRRDARQLLLLGGRLDPGRPRPLAAGLGGGLPGGGRRRQRAGRGCRRLALIGRADRALTAAMPGPQKEHHHGRTAVRPTHTVSGPRRFPTAVSSAHSPVGRSPAGLPRVGAPPQPSRRTTSVRGTPATTTPSAGAPMPPFIARGTASTTMVR